MLLTVPFTATSAEGAAMDEVFRQSDSIDAVAPPAVFASRWRDERSDERTRFRLGRSQPKLERECEVGEKTWSAKPAGPSPQFVNTIYPGILGWSVTLEDQW